MTTRRRTTRLALSIGMLALLAGPAAAQPSMPGDVLAIACGPRASYEVPDARLTVGGSLAGAKGVYAPWHRIVITAGSEDGLQAGQQFYVRRIVPPRQMPSKGDKVVHAVATAGWVRIDEIQPRRSIATILHECDGISPGDFLEPFSVPTVPASLPDGKADYSQPGRVLFGAERQQLGGAGSMLLIDRGTNQGIQPGQRLTIFRGSEAGPNVIVARATAVAVQPDFSMVKIQEMRDAVMAGDFVAPHR